MAGELPYLPQCHQDVSTEDPVPGHQQKLQAAVHVRASSDKGELPSPQFLGVPRAAETLSWRSTEEDILGASKTCLSWKTYFGLRLSSWEGFILQGSRTITCTQVPAHATTLRRRLTKSTLLLIPLFGVHYVVFALFPEHIGVDARLYFELVLGSYQVQTGGDG